MARNQVAARGANTVPPAGPTQVHVSGVAGGGMLLPDTLQVQQMADLFFERSEQNFLQLDRVALIPGSQTQFKLQNVGLGEGLELMVTGQFDIQNTTAGAVTVNFAPEFPYNIIADLRMMFNGKVAVISASGYDLFRVMQKRAYRSDFITTFNPVGGSPAQSMRVDRRIAAAEVSTVSGGVTSTAPGDTLTGIASMTIPAAGVARVTFNAYLDISFVLRKDLPFGLIPMQHNAIYASVEVRANSILSTTFDTPLQMGVITGINVLAPVITAQPTYSFWGLPDNPELYSFFVNNSYVLTNLSRNPIASTGARALTFNFPLNYWLIAAIFTVRHGAARALADVLLMVDNPVLIYNGTIHVDRTDMRTRTAREIYHTGRMYPYGTVMFDGAQTNNLDGNSVNMARWLNMYLANNPLYHTDIVGGFTLPGSFDVLLEQLIPNHVTVI